MNGHQIISKEKREAILRRIKDGGEPASKVATENGVSPKTVYNWLAEPSEKSAVSWPEYNRVRRENEQLKAIVGELTLGLKRTKKI